MSTRQHMVMRRQLGFHGVAVTFSKTTITYDAETDQSTPTTTSIAGTGMRIQGDPAKYEELGLVGEGALTLQFTPDNEDTLPDLGARVTWDGDLYTVRSVDPVSPTGSGIGAIVVVAR